MCGRYSNAQPHQQFTAAVRDQLEDQHGHASKEKAASEGSSGSKANSQPAVLSQLKEGDYYPTHNVAPSTRAPILRLEKPVPLPLDGKTANKDEVEVTSGEDNNLVIECMRWGLLPARTQFIPHGADALRTINARDDSVMSGQSMWTPLLKKGKRCIVFCQGFYEWLKKPDGSRVAHFCGMQDEGNGRVDVQGKQRALMPMAGLYEQCTIDGQPLLSFTIITTDSNKQLNFLHDRMPVILPDHRAMMTWLGALPASSREVCSLLKPYDRGSLDLYPVPREVGKVGNDDKSFILPVSARKDGIAAAFGRKQKVEKDVNSETHAPLSEEIKAVEGKGKRKRQEEEDERLARELQEKEEEDLKRVKIDVKTESAGHAEPQSKDSQEKAESNVKAEEADENVDKGEQPSSRFSPEPFNPPVSPPRPQGGYSGSTHDGKETSPRKTPSKALTEAAKGTKDIRNFFGSK